MEVEELDRMNTMSSDDNADINAILETLTSTIKNQKDVMSRALDSNGAEDEVSNILDIVPPPANGEVKNRSKTNSMAASILGENVNTETPKVAKNSQLTKSGEDTPEDKPAKKFDKPEDRSKLLDEAEKELNSLIGLAGVKEDVKMNRATLETELTRKELGLIDDANSTASYHIVFEGRPGTGKTTVARIYAKILRGLGIITSDAFIETSRDGLVGMYQGETSLKVKKVVDNALDGVLFIDEVYSLQNNSLTSKDTYGDEAISTLLKCMEDYRDRLVIIAAGYTNETEKFLDSNPGLRSRFSEKIVFEDYTDDQLVSILEGMAKKRNIIISNANKTELKRDFKELRATAAFANGRTARILLDNAIKEQSMRFVDKNNKAKEAKKPLTDDEKRKMLTHLTKSDIKEAFDKTMDMARSNRTKPTVEDLLK